ncbi:MAG: ATP-binding cassette domain-containing protein, partial [Burkholderiales bacterium]|nr:ATP-binding cassette domain-containing protein [Anaerolineae bacterium]
RTLILDEPTTGISSEQKELLFEALHEISQHDGMTVLIVSHKLEDVVALCNEVVVLRAGKVVGERQMPATTKQLVAMMFGEELTVQTKEQQAIKEKRNSDREVVVLERVSLREKRLHIDNLSMRVYAGQIIGLAGLDGSGQELVMRACVGLAKTHGGRVLVEGRDMTGKPYRYFKRCGIAFGASGRLEEGLVAGLTLTEHVALATESGALIDWERARLHTEQQIQHYNVRGRPNSPIETLSGGNQQRMLMALLPTQPKLLALEQPTRGLDIDSAQWIWQQLLGRRDSGTSIMFSSPDLDELVTYSDRILVFYAGHVMEISDAATTSIDELGRLIGGDYTEHR